jgi:hypothetical protein
VGPWAQATKVNTARKMGMLLLILIALIIYAAIHFSLSKEVGEVGLHGLLLPGTLACP